MFHMRAHAILIAVALFALSGTFTFGQDSETLFNQKCANCHGKDGSGHTVAATKMKIPDLRTKEFRAISDTDMYSSIAQGTKHYAYPHAFLHIGLTEAQIQGLVRYIRELQAGKTALEAKVVVQ